MTRTPFPLCSALRRARGSGQQHAVDASAELEHALATAMASAREAMPKVSIPDDAFCEYLAARLDFGQDAVDAIQKAKTSDLYLACGCTRGDHHAISEFDRRFLRTVDASLARMNLPPEALDE